MFLAPWAPDDLVSQCFLYSLAEAQRRTGMAVHHWVTVMNHAHLDGTPTKANVPEFTWRLHLDVSKSLNALMRELKYDSPRQLLGRAADASDAAAWMRRRRWRICSTSI